jgi:hypothetical protein
MGMLSAHAALASRVLCGRRHTLRLLLADSRAKASRVGTLANAPSVSRTLINCLDSSSEEVDTAGGFVLL